MFQIVPCVIDQHILKIPRKSIVPFCRNDANRHVAVPRLDTVKHSSQVWNSLANYFLCRPWQFLEISWKSVHPFLHDITNKHE